MLFLGIIVTNAQTDTDPTGWVYIGDSKDYENEHVVYVGLVDANGDALSFETDDVLWLGAFIEDECRGIKEIENETTNKGVVYYFPMRVKGSSNDNGKAISFKLYKSISIDPENSSRNPSGFWYELNEFNGNSLTYVNEENANNPSQLFKLKFVEPTGYTFPNEVTVNLNDTINLLPRFTWEPENATVPTNATNIWSYAWQYAIFDISDNVLKGNSPSYPEADALNIYFYTQITGMTDSDGTSDVKVFVREPITAITIPDVYKKEHEVYINDGYILTEIMNNCYTLSPENTNEEPVWSWEPKDAFTESINSETQEKEWTPKKAGHYTLTLTGEANKVTAEIKVWVKNRVESLEENINEIHLFVGDNLTDLIPYTYTIAPNDENTNTAIFRSFTNPEDGIEVLKENENTQVITANAVGEATLCIGAHDNQGCLIKIPVIVHPNVTEVSISKSNLAFEIGEGSLDITNEFFANIKFAPDGEYKPVEGEIISTNADVCELTYASNTKTWTATAKSTGATASSSIEISHSATRTTLNDGALTTKDASISNKFLVTVSQGLINFICTPDTIIMGRNQVRTITLKPNPETATFDPERITVEVIVNPNFTAWELAKAEPVANDETGLQWAITPEAIGSGNIIIKYNGEEKGSNSGITIGQNFNQEIGWAWVTPYGGNIESIEALYGDALQEMRSQTSLLFNDPVYGYFGQLKTMEQMKGYKVNTKSAMSDGNYNKGTYPYEPYKPTDFEFNPKWNWFGTPYQFDRAVNEIMTAIDFTEGDRIVSKAGGFTEFNGTEWEGSLTTLKAGEGYLLYTGIEAYSSFEYPAEYELGKPASQPSNAHALNKQANVWDYNSAQFSDNMSMIADLGEEFADDRYSIGAYINGECRGEGVCVNGKWFITIHGDAASNGQAINFRVYDTMNGKTYDVDTTQPYSQMAGTLKAPISLKVAGSSTGIESISADSLNPNVKYYTIDGIEVTNPTTGLYIVVDGNKAQKVYVK